jgi:hypothetical protein
MLRRRTSIAISGFRFAPDVLVGGFLGARIYQLEITATLMPGDREIA